MKKYDAYKDSGVKWIGEIPNHWEVVPLKRTGSFENGLTYSPNDIRDKGYIVLRYSNIQNSKMNYEDTVYVESVPNDLLVKKGDLIICSRNGSASLVGKCANFDGKIAATFGAFMMRYSPSINNEYAFFSFQILMRNYKGLFTTSTINQLTKNVIAQMVCPLPPLSEQQAIASYLDAKTEKIDKMIAKAEKKIEYLGELKQSLITRAVTRGLNPNASLKDSGVKWIGKVPEHWETIKLSRVYSYIGSGTTPLSSQEDYYSEEGYNWLQTGDLNNGLITQTSKKITKKAIDECRMKFYPKHSVVIAMYGATIGKVGLLDLESTTNQACCVISPTQKMNPLFTFYSFMAAKKELLLASFGGGQPNISQDIIKKLRVPVPPLEEQNAIILSLKKECDTIDHIIATQKKKIAYLQELKQSLITNVVTGKIKVS